MWNAGLDDSQARIRIAGRNINNLRYADDTLWQKVKRNKKIQEWSMKSKHKPDVSFWESFSLLIKETHIAGAPTSSSPWLFVL